MNLVSKACQMTPYKGAIPVGSYFIKPDEFSDPDMLGDLMRNFRLDHPGDWGDWRVRIHAKPNTNTWGRDEFLYMEVVLRALLGV
ncbi:hypothetical protein NL53_14435 [Vibrio variabilis]|uniref:Uncharacterized protein n=2 Tax=Vibrio variabilis TaxID=990271 RepID=A0ABR4Y8P9_9VIBR|nr:hypothetical protein NL53_14435 [Vibrio variabilis]